MEDTHGGENAYSYPCSIYTVLILIIMEDTHGGDKPKGFDGAVCSLNPYYNGRYSWRAKKGCGRSKSGRVLILIIMEDTHGEDTV